MKVKVINKSQFPLPAKATEGAAGFDLFGQISPTIWEILPFTTRLIPTGLFMELPEGLRGASTQHGREWH